MKKWLTGRSCCSERRPAARGSALRSRPGAVGPVRRSEAGGPAAPAHVLERDDEDDDEAFESGDHVGRHARGDLQGVPADDQPAEEEGGDDRPERVQRPEEGHDDPVETVGAGEPGQAAVGHHPVRDAAEDEQRPAEAAHGPADGHGECHRPLHRHAGVLEASRDRPTAWIRKPKLGAVDEDPDPDSDDHCDQHAEVELACSG